MLPAPPRADEGPPRDPQTVVVSFSGPCSGDLSLTVSRELMPSLAASILGSDDTPTESEQLDALGEIANIVCGNVLPEAFAEDEPFLLSAPRPVTAVARGDGGLELAAEARLWLDEGRADLALYLAPGA